MTLSPGTMLENRYRIEQPLAQGGMGAIYQAFDTNLDIPVAIKENFFRTPQSISQFQKEAQILARLHHPNLPRVIQHFSHKGSQYLVMDFVEGQDLWEMVQQREQPLNERQALDYLTQVCDAVEYLHRQRPPIIHRDIKPQNIKITPMGQAVLVDFGIAKVAGDDSQTQTGAQGVTPGFSPPEQYSGEGTVPASDVYSLGATLYAVLTGQKPPHSVSLLVDQSKFKPPTAINRNLSEQASRAVMHAMQVRIADRPPSTKAWKRELEAALAAIPTPDNEETMSGRKAAAGWLIASNGQQFQLNVGSYSLGRAPTCDFQLNDPRASRRHATIKFDGRQCRVVDEGSANGTFINEQPVGGRAVPLNLGERLRIGDTTLQFSLADSLTAVSMPVVLAPAVDELSGTVLESEPGPVSVAALRPPSAPVARSPAQQVPPAGSPSAAPPQKSGGLGWLWLSLSGLVIVLLLAAIGVLLYVQNNTTAAPAVNQQETALAQAFATGEAIAALTQTAIPGPTPSITPTPSRTAESTATATRVQVGADTLEPSPSPTAPLTASPTGTAAATRTPTATDVPLTATFTPTSTPSPSPSPLPVAPLPVGVFQGFETDSVWKRGDEPNGELNRSSEQVHSGRFAGRLDYNFPTGSNDYVVFLQNHLLADTPKAMTVWVYGDGAGHFLNVWFKDAAGQTWQMSFGPVKHTGWQQMTAVLDPAQPWPSGHISGPNNGVIDYPIRFQGIVLDDGSDSFTGRGTIYIDDMATAKNTSTKPTPISGPNPGAQ